jgi:hypothetical protein
MTENISTQRYCLKGFRDAAFPFIIFYIVEVWKWSNRQGSWAEIPGCKRVDEKLLRRRYGGNSV